MLAALALQPGERVLDVGSEPSSAQLTFRGRSVWRPPCAFVAQHFLDHAVLGLIAPRGFKTRILRHLPGETSVTMIGWLPASPRHLISQHSGDLVRFPRNRVSCRCTAHLRHAEVHSVSSGPARGAARRAVGLTPAV